MNFRAILQNTVNSIQRKNGGHILKNVDTDMERSVLASMILSPEYIPET